MSKHLRSVRLELLEEQSLRASAKGVMLQIEPADVLLMIDEIRAARTAERKTTGADRIAKERQRQIDKEGWTSDHDDEHNDGSLAMAAVCYAAQAADERVYVRKDYAASVSFNDPWPWEERADARFYGAGEQRGNVLCDPPDDAFRIRLLEKAGALIAAEIDRLTRLDELLKANRKALRK